MPPSKPLRPTAYTVGILTVLPCETAAVVATLDIEHERPKIVHDDNLYRAGSIGRHNVVIACAGESGTSPASNCATHMLRSFPNIRIGLLIGIGGGVPSERNDIRLGDVVVSQPGNGHGGVAFYDAGKLTDSGFRPTGHLDRPPAKLCKAATWLQTQRIGGATEFDSILTQLAHIPRYQYPRDSPDILHDASDSARVVDREPRSTQMPLVHYGLIASGSWVIKSNGSKRADLINQVNGDVLCFEMEAAALMNSFPCLVIRGISDYCDSYKNDGWHDYASATAACYAKWLLSVLTAQDVDATVMDVTAVDRIAQGAIDVFDRRETWTVSRPGAESWDTILNRLSDYNHEKAHRRLTRKRTPETTGWFINTVQYRNWTSSPQGSAQSCLWLSGDIGCGKTMVCSRVVDHQRHLSMKMHNAVAFIYCDRSEKKTLDPCYVIASLVKQTILHHQKLLQQHVPALQQEALRSFFSAEGKVPDLEDFEEIFEGIHRTFTDTVYVIDGLHEMEKEDVRGIESLLLTLAKHRCQPKFFISSRDDANKCGLNYKISPDFTESDIARFIDSELEDPIIDEPALTARIKRGLAEKARGMFLWVRLQIEALRLDCKTKGDIFAALDRLPRSLSETYERCLERASRTDASMVRKAFMWIMFATRPLSMSELLDAVVLDLGDTHWNRSHQPLKSRLLGYCSNLVVEDIADDTIGFAHPSVMEFLTNEDLCPKSFYLEPAEELYIGELCVTYLSFDDFSQSVQRTSTAVHNIALPSPMHSVAGGLPGAANLISRLLPRYSNKSGPAVVNKPITITKATSTHTHDDKFALLDYARQNWPVHTTSISKDSTVWSKFSGLVFEQNVVWKFQPWASSPLSRYAYLHAILAWTARNGHEPILDMVLGLFMRGNERHKRELFDLPYARDGMPALHVAARLGFARTVLRLMSFCNVNAPGPESMTALHFAAEKDRDEVASILLEDRRTKPDLLSESGESALATASRVGSLNVAQLLCERKDVFNTPTALRYSHPLQLSIESGHADIAAMLWLHPRSEIDRNPRMCDRIVSLATAKGRIDVLNKLLDHPHAYDLAQSSLGRILISAAQDGDAKAVQSLTQCDKFDGNVVEESTGHTALGIAAARGNTTLVSLLLISSGVIANKPDGVGNTPLHLAAMNGQCEVALILLHYISANMKNHHGENALMLAIMCNEKEMVWLFIASGLFDLNSIDQHGWTPLIFAARHEDCDVLQAILRYDEVSVNHKDSRGWTALFHAVTLRSVEHVRLLMNDQRTKKNVRDKTSRTALHRAAKSDSVEIVKLFLDSGGVDIDVADCDSLTPLTAAVVLGSTRAACLLAACSAADTLRIVDEGMTVVEYASHHGMVDVLDVLLQRDDFQEIPTIATLAKRNRYSEIVRLLRKRRKVIMSSQPSEQQRTE